MKVRALHHNARAERLALHGSGQHNGEGRAWRRAGRTLLAAAATAVVAPLTASPWTGTLVAAQQAGPTPVATKIVPSGSDCHGLSLVARPGLNPVPGRSRQIRIAPDAPRTNLTVSVPLYPTAAPLAAFVASPFPEYSLDPYLQTAAVEYTVPAPVSGVSSWVTRTFTACGWHPAGGWGRNASAFTTGTVWRRSARPEINENPDVKVYFSLGQRAGGGTYLAYAVEAIVLPPRPSASYLHGPFSNVQIAVRRGHVVNGQLVSRVVHVTVRDVDAINRLVGAVDAIRGRRTTMRGIVCAGGMRVNGPAWLTFTRPTGSQVHAYEVGPGVCGGGLAVDGVRWLVDPGAVWDQVLALTQPAPGK